MTVRNFRIRCFNYKLLVISFIYWYHNLLHICFFQSKNIDSEPKNYYYNDSYIHVIFIWFNLVWKIFGFKYGQVT